ncbi:hypothetical protein ACWM3R_001406 [Vibrio cholerae]
MTIAPKGYYRATIWGTADSPEIIVYSNGSNYYSFDSASPEKPLDPADVVLDLIPLFPNASEKELKSAIWKAREFIIKTANQYKQDGYLCIQNSLEGGKLVTELDAILDVREVE